MAGAVHVLGDAGVIDKFGGAFHFLGQRFAKGDFAFERIEIGAFADVAVADRVDIFFGVLGMNGILLGNRLILRGLGLRGLWRGGLRWSLRWTRSLQTEKVAAEQAAGPALEPGSACC